MPRILQKTVRTLGFGALTLGSGAAVYGAVERAPWPMPMVGTLARFTDPSGTVYGLATSPSAAPLPHVPAPFGDAPKPPHGTVCSLEMHAGDLEAAARFFGSQFGWGTLPTMPQFLMFDAGAGIGGVFQSHTPASRGVVYRYESLSETSGRFDIEYPGLSDVPLGPFVATGGALELIFDICGVQGTIDGLSYVPNGRNNRVRYEVNWRAGRRR